MATMYPSERDEWHWRETELIKRAEAAESTLAALQSRWDARQQALRTLLASREFYEVMYAYRHTPILPPQGVIDAFEAVKAFLLAADLDAARAVTGETPTDAAD